MRRGQLFILAAFVIAVGIAALANLGFFTSLPVQKEQTAIGSAGPTLHNIDAEIIYVTKMGPGDQARINDFLLILKNFTYEKNFEGDLLKTGG